MTPRLPFGRKLIEFLLLSRRQLNAEVTTPAQPGMALVDKPCWGNERGMLFQYTQVEDSGEFKLPTKARGRRTRG